ncbi:MAG: T9SS type A sorting domain-containing protein, partial [Candidatus Kryptoniota bacterium]
FNPTTTISYDIAKRTFVRLLIYDVLGREVRDLVNEEKGPGNYSVIFDASNLPSGVYFYKMVAGDFVGAKKLVVMK